MSLETSVMRRDLKSDIQTSVVNHSNLFQEILEDFPSFDYARLKWFCHELFLFVLIFSLPLGIVYVNSIKYLWRIRNWTHKDVEVMVGVTYRLPHIVCTGTSYCWSWVKSGIYRKCCFLWTWSKLLDIVLTLCIPCKLVSLVSEGCCNLLPIWSNLR